jgi:hypothetical protein
MTTNIDLSEFEGEVTPRLCKVSRIHALLDEDKQKKLQAALEEESVSSERICTALEGWGFRVRPTTVKVHRRKGCTCP